MTAAQYRKQCLPTRGKNGTAAGRQRYAITPNAQGMEASTKDLLDMLQDFTTSLDFNMMN